MRLSRIYIDLPLQLDKKIALSAMASHHINKVLRMRIGQSIIIFNGTGGQYIADITTIEKNQVVVQTREFQDLNRESPLHITLEQGISRGQHMDFTIQKAAELGVSRIIPIITEFCNVKLDDERRKNRQEHWQKIAISACEQSGRNRLPVISSVTHYKEYTESNDSDHKYILVPEVKSTLHQLNESIDQINILCGPEGGLSDTEVKIAVDNGYSPVSMGPRILRTETAAIAAITASQVIWGDMTILG